MPHEIEVKNLGPIAEASFCLSDYGVTCLVGSNGIGKSILLDAVQKAALGTGKLALRDGQRRGSLQVGGAVISIGAATRHNGEFQIENIESRMPLSMLVDPRMKTAEAADKQRIKALVALTGVAASRDLFAKHEALSDFADVVSDESTATDDLVEMSGRIKRDYESKAREAERDADREEGHIRGLEEAGAGVDLTAESDAAKLQTEYDAARDKHAAIDARITEYARTKEDADTAHADLLKLEAGYVGASLAEVSAADAEAVRVHGECLSLVEKLESQLAAAKTQLDLAAEKSTAADALLQRASSHFKSLGVLRETIDRFSRTRAVGDDIGAASTELDAARRAQEQGVKIRDAREKLAKAAEHKAAAAAARDKANRLRYAAKCVDEVLSDAIQCPQLRVELQDGVTRLVTDHPTRGKSVPYHELSEGERWKLAIDLGVERVGQGGLLVIDQSAWEGLDSFVRPEIHAHAKAKQCFILTAEATRDPEDGREMVAKPFAL